MSSSVYLPDTLLILQSCGNCVWRYKIEKWRQLRAVSRNKCYIHTGWLSAVSGAGQVKEIPAE